MARTKLVFMVASPPGYHVVLTRNRWREIVRYKHPALAGHEADLQECVADPELVRESAKDAEVHLYYRAGNRGHLCVVVGGDDPDERFVATAYFTKNIKKGRELWTR